MSGRIFVAVDDETVECHLHVWHGWSWGNVNGPAAREKVGLPSDRLPEDTPGGYDRLLAALLGAHALEHAGVNDTHSRPLLHSHGHAGEPFCIRDARQRLRS